MMSVVTRTYWVGGPTRLKECLIPWMTWESGASLPALPVCRM